MQSPVISLFAGVMFKAARWITDRVKQAEAKFKPEDVLRHRPDASIAAYFQDIAANECGLRYDIIEDDENRDDTFHAAAVEFAKEAEGRSTQKGSDDRGAALVQVKCREMRIPAQLPTQRWRQEDLTACHALCRSTLAFLGILWEGSPQDRPDWYARRRHRHSMQERGLKFWAPEFGWG